MTEKSRWSPNQCGKIDPNEVLGWRMAIQMMKKAGINPIIMGCIIQDIRSATIQSERMRIDNLVRNNPPCFPTQSEIADAFSGLEDDE